MSTYTVIGISALLAVLLLLGCVLVFPKLLVSNLPDASLNEIRGAKDRLALQTDRLKLQNDARTGLLQGLAGAALIGGLLFTWVQLQDNRAQLAAQQDLTRRGQIADRFTRAVEQLGNQGNLDVRLGGIYALEQIARDAHDDRTRLAVYEVLTAYVRNHAAWNQKGPPLLKPLIPAEGSSVAPGAENPDIQLPRRLPDVQAVMTALARRDFAPLDPSLDLTNVDIRYLNLGPEARGLPPSSHQGFGARLGHADLSSAHLAGAYLEGANLENADLYRADLTGSNIDLVDLTSAFLAAAHLEGVHAYFARLNGTDLSGAYLEGAIMTAAVLEGADFSQAHLERADFTGAHLSRADFYGAHLDGADLSKADLRNVDLSKALGLEDARLEGAQADQTTKWPAGFDWQKSGAHIVPKLCGAPNNPWGYNFCGGAIITRPPAAFCQYFTCIGNFWNGRGYVVECQDGMLSKSGGIPGSCSYHNGDLRPLYR